MSNFKIMTSMRSRKAFVAALIVALSSATIGAPEGFTLTEILTIAGATVTAFQATYWTPNKIEYDGQLDIDDTNGESKMFTLTLDSDPNDLETKKEVTFKVNPT